MAASALRITHLVSLLWILSLISVSQCEVCSYHQSNWFDTDYTYYKACEWGCCGTYTADPCCSAPVGVIIGIVVGCILLLAGIILCICCICCICRRSNTPGRVVTYPSQQGAAVHFSVASGASHGQGAVTVQSTVGNSAMNTSLSPAVYMPPPAYDDVMRGQVNPAFKAHDNPPAAEATRDPTADEVPSTV